MKTTQMTKAMLHSMCAIIVANGAASAQSVSLIDLRFNSSNPDDVAAHPAITSVSPWSNGSVVGFLGLNPTPDFSNGYAGLSQLLGGAQFRWGFDGQFVVGGATSFQVESITFDYFVDGHNGEGLLNLQVGPWSGTAPLPSTESGRHALFADPGGSTGDAAQGSVTFDFINNLLTVSRIGISSYTTPLTSDFQISPGTQSLDILTQNTYFGEGGYWDANVASVGIGGQTGAYRIDNFRIDVSPIPEPSSALLGGLGALALLLRRQRRGA